MCSLRFESEAHFCIVVERNCESTEVLYAFMHVGGGVTNLLDVATVVC